MKKNGIIMILAFCSLLTFFCCTPEKKQSPDLKKEKEAISYIEFSTIGGQLGNYRIIKIDQDSLHFENGITATNKHKEWQQAINPKIWKDLANTLTISDLDKITSAPSVQPFDGVDETFQIKTQKTTHFYVNSYNDSIHYPQLQQLKNKIESLLPKEN